MKLFNSRGPIPEDKANFCGIPFAQKPGETGSKFESSESVLLEKRIPLSYIYGKIRYDIWIVLVIVVISHFLADWYEKVIPPMPIGIPAFLGTAISVILSFKINQSYDRWWEARKVWGSIVNDSRTLVLQLQTFIKDESSALIRQMAMRQIAWSYALAYSLRKVELGREVEKYLKTHDYNELKNHENKPLAILQMHSRDLRSLREEDGVDPIRQVQMDSTIVRLTDSMGKAERINTTVFPTTYRLFLSGIIYLFIVTLSISLRETEIWFELPLIVLLSMTFLLLQKTAYHLQDPFRNRPSDTSVLAISRTIEINLLQLIGEKEVPAQMVSDTFYIL